MTPEDAIIAIKLLKPDIENRWKEAMRDPFKDPDMLTTVYKRLMKERRQ